MPPGAGNGTGNGTGNGLAPDLDWLEGGVPFAPAYGDSYFSRAGGPQGGLAESRHVFLAGTGLPERFLGRGTFTVAELGFGTGLNFLATLAALAESLAEAPGAPAGPRLTYVGFERHPLSRAQMARALAPFADLAAFADALLSRWAPAAGWQRIEMAGAELWLAVGDANALVPELARRAGLGPVDAWYLDGFSPARNPELWSGDLLRAVFAATAPGGRFATYAAAGRVRRALEAAGFRVERRKGFAAKREMLAGTKLDSSKNLAISVRF
ncbi:tRNA (5-methylaminomethyl-2-thiouridine)(34)-methyltransferase MnmD [Polymorphum gilvum]|uniref:FAD-dependent cmnm(5)s(2)U34 oxidoreductase n=1 Tax=Polymorphum gilvum (strain LMG 25793 / CGMCC 1.9160 / SL003B-26A1) TaxID=991905 RepID=F2IW72_POLGS|nr:tRNA (5-methylaminomethyl-2-thiouridine)(34)-methyltransferase MnmD [Polymorphum gilvum]ADZ71457.1 FAD-dependent cmnm(5)s(2)U34 oxidoreductase [Polymorphum gilvum SL003B-26A1]